MQSRIVIPLTISALIALGLGGALAVREGNGPCCGLDLPDPGPVAFAAGAGAEDAVKSEKKEEPGKPKKEEAPDPSLGGVEADPKATGAIAGMVTLKGKTPEAKPHQIPPEHKDRAVCGDMAPDERYVVGAGNALANAVASLEKVPGASKPPPRPITLDNVRCRFVPHVQATTAGSSITITTQDRGILHSAMALTPPGFNVSIQNADQPVVKTLPRPGWVPIKCAVHDWMLAHVQVFPHDFFAVTLKEGKFRIRGIPPGKYQLKVWHEALEESRQEVTVEAGKTVEVKAELEPYKD